MYLLFIYVSLFFNVAFQLLLIYLVSYLFINDLGVLYIFWTQGHLCTSNIFCGLPRYFLSNVY